MMWVGNAMKYGFMVGLLIAVLPASADDTLVPGVVADGDTLFLMNQSGGIDALATATGNVLWSSNAAAKPLTLRGDILVGQTDSTRGGTLDIVFLSKRTGAIEQRMSITIPGDVWAQVDAQLNRTFIARGGVRNGDIYLAWEHSFAKRGGAKLTPDAPGPQLLNGAHRVDPLTNTYRDADQTVLNREMPDLPGPLQQMSSRGELNGSPLYTGTTFAATTASNRSGNRSLTLMRWRANNGVRLPDIVVAANAYVMHLPSVDQNHLLVSRRTAPGTWAEYQWSIVDLNTGQRVGEMQHHFSHAQFIVNGTVLVHEARPYGRNQNNQWVEVPRQLRGVQLSNGNQVWTRQLRDTSYRGQIPP